MRLKIGVNFGTSLNMGGELIHRSYVRRCLNATAGHSPCKILELYDFILSIPMTVVSIFKFWRLVMFLM